MNKRKLQQAAKDLRRNMTPAEQALWQRLRANRSNGLHFRRQHVIDRFIVDFYCHGAGLVVEVDGDVHDRQPGHDAERQRMLTARGLRVVRFTNDQVLNDIDSVVEEIRRTADLSPWPPSKGERANLSP